MCPLDGIGNHVQAHKAELRSPRTTQTDKPKPANGQRRSRALDGPRTRGERDAHKLQELAGSRNLKVQNWQVILYAYRNRIELKHTRDQCLPFWSTGLGRWEESSSSRNAPPALTKDKGHDRRAHDTYASTPSDERARRALPSVHSRAT